ncbi:MAG TPA: dethiobiotin synthase [Flavobacteriales bacterium]|nr:dethiobiotin synthase [Flavobacteriales bacterium]
MSKRYFVTGIGTGVGKTLVCAVLAEAMKADYFKPVQCGNLDSTDSDFIAEHLFNSKSKVHHGGHAYRLAASPHAAAVAEGKKLNLADIYLPETKNTLLVEGAGGILVPLNNEHEYVIHIAKKHELEIILVVDYYLGSINHSLLTLQYLKTNNYKIAFLVFNGDKVESSKKAILQAAGDLPFVEIPRFEVSPESIKDQADLLVEKLSKNLEHA